MINTDRAGVNGLAGHAESFEDVFAHRMGGLRAQAFDAAGRVVAGERGQVHEGDGAQKPCGLPILLHRAAAAEGGGAVFETGQIGLHGFNP